MSVKTAFVTGGSGFLGRHLIEELLAADWNITVLHRTSSDVSWLRDLNVELGCGSLDDVASLTNVLPWDVDAVFHVAGDTGFWRQNNKRQHQVNVIGTRNMLEAALNKRAGRFVHTSTVGVYGIGSQDLSEQAPHEGRHSPIGYLSTKAQAEEQVRAYIARGLDAVIVNPCNIIGPYDQHNWSRLFRMIHEDSLPGVPPGSGSFCHARDVVRGHIAAYEKGRTGENYILNGPNASHLRVIQIAATVLGRVPPTRTTPGVILKLLGGVSQLASHFNHQEPDLTPEGAQIICAHQRVVTDKAVVELGYVSQDIETMISDCIGWMKAEHLLT